MTHAGAMTVVIIPFTWHADLLRTIWTRIPAQYRRASLDSVRTPGPGGQVPCPGCLGQGVPNRTACARKVP